MIHGYPAESIEQRGFQFDTNLIYEAIIRQSDSVIGALAELVQNSADAGATECHICFDEHQFTVTDNGRGFKSRDEILTWFEIFGKPHDTEDPRRFGKFRMGRGQIMGYASTIWESGQFIMDVDVKVRGLTYGLITTATQLDGCRIAGRWYNEKGKSCLFRGLGFFDDDDTIEKIGLSLSQKLRYIYGMQVFINGVANDFSAIPWEYEDDYFLFTRLDDNEVFSYARNGYVKFYNLGIYIDSVPIHRMTGRVVTKKTMSVNITRTKIKDDCPVLAHIKAKLRELAPKYTQSKKYSAWEARDILAGLLSRQVNYKEVCKLKMFQNIRGTTYPSLNDLASKPFVITPPGKQFEVIADQIHAQGLCLALKNETNHLFKITTKPMEVSFAEAIHLVFGNEFPESNQIFNNMLDFDSVYQQLDMEKTELTTGDQPLHVQLKLKALNLCRYDISKCFRSSNKTREFYAGISATAYAWTDCKEKIVIELSDLNLIDNGFSGVLILLLTIAHEYSHVEDNVVHNGEFTGKFHDSVIRADLFSLASKILRKYDDLLAKEGVRPSISVEKAMRLARRDGRAKSSSS